MDNEASWVYFIPFPLSPAFWFSDREFGKWRDKSMVKCGRNMMRNDFVQGVWEEGVSLCRWQAK